MGMESAGGGKVAGDACAAPGFETAVSTECIDITCVWSARDSFGDDAIGYIQVKRASDVCTVKCRITREHRVRTTRYRCSIECNEKDHEILNITCEDCFANRGCKHCRRENSTTIKFVGCFCGYNKNNYYFSGCICTFRHNT
ncbi:uncharacterized protein LOC131847469 [Achroia grisella]|uniref:uncharacterized protein LOC131847469 n=1 Tax=Achroia grisella TaxID=688607 RepID=UPI0027D27A0D|nr:uncharacterized protein LOC131847469 [Achroia grisella]